MLKACNNLAGTGITHAELRPVAAPQNFLPPLPLKREIFQNFPAKMIEK